MKYARYAGLAVLLIAYIGLVRMMIQGAGFTLRTIFLAVASGIIIFVPLWRKYFSGNEK